MLDRVVDRNFVVVPGGIYFMRGPDEDDPGRPRAPFRTETFRRIYAGSNPALRVCARSGY